MAALFAIAAGAAHAQADRGQATQLRVSDYRTVFEDCRGVEAGPPRLAIRRMEIDGTAMLLTVDLATLATRLDHAQDWACAATDDARQKDTRYLAAIGAAGAARPGGRAAMSDVIANGGLLRGAGAAIDAGAFITGDLCPSHRRLDRAFLAKLQAVQSPMPLALAISGAWLARHNDDFQWLRAQERAGWLQITWVDHSYSHPFEPGRPLAENFLLTPGIDMAREILDTERLLIANGATPSVFFRFPGLIANPALMRTAADFHLVVIGAAAWLARSPNPRPGDIVLVHPNGNEPAGLAIFSTLLADGKLPHPFRPITEAP